MPYPNLPYLKEGDFVVTESKAILYHVARRHRPAMLGATIEEQARHDTCFHYVQSF